MRIPGIVPNTAAEVSWWQHLDIVRECKQRREGWEARYGPRHGCPYGCDGSGWREVEEDDPTPYPFEVVHDDKLYTWCECNGQLVLVNGHYEPRPVRPFQKTAA